MTISARVETDQVIPGIPQNLEYAVPEAFEDLILLHADPFVVALLQFAMAINEPIEIEGSISPVLYAQLGQFQEAFSLWYPQVFKRVRIVPAGLRSAAAAPAPGTAVFFSGGLDSLYILYRELKNDDPFQPFRITHGVYCYFDQPNRNYADYARRAARYDRLFSDNALQLVRVKTNHRRFQLGNDDSERRRWVYNTYGGGIAAAGMLLSAGIGRGYIGSNNPITWIVRNGSNPITDHMLSNERFRFIYHSLMETREDKLRAIMNWDEGFSMLNVCWWRMDAEKNCGRCPKCIRTLAQLEVLGLTARHDFFKPSRWYDRIRWFSTIGESGYTREILESAVAHRATRIAAVAMLGLLIVRIKRGVRGLVRILVPGFKQESV